MKIKRFWHMVNKSYIICVDAYGIFLAWSENNGLIHDISIEFHDTHPSFGNMIKSKEDEYDIEDIDVKTCVKQIESLIQHFSFKPVPIDVPSVKYTGTYEKKYVLASSNRMILKMLELIKFYIQHPTGDIL